MTPPTLEECRRASEFGFLRAIDIVKRATACLERGDAILSREDREQALKLVYSGLGINEQEARRLLQLPEDRS